MVSDSFSVVWQTHSYKLISSVYVNAYFSSHLTQEGKLACFPTSQTIHPPPPPLFLNNNLKAGLVAAIFTEQPIPAVQKLKHY